MTDPGPHVPDYDRKGCQSTATDDGSRCGAKPVRYHHVLKIYACFGKNTPNHSGTRRMGGRRHGGRSSGK